MNDKKQTKTSVLHSAKDCAVVAVFTALVIATQFVLSAVPGVELVTVLFASFSAVFGKGRGAFAGLAFAILRSFIFGFFPTVFILYLLYFPLFAFWTATLNRKIRTPLKSLVVNLLSACVCTLLFGVLDGCIWALYFGSSIEAAVAYIVASAPFTFIQTGCVAVTVGVLFVPLCSAFRSINRV